MRLSGEYQYGSEEYFVFCNFTKASKAYYIYTKVAAEDRVAYELGGELQNPILDSRVNIYAAKDTRKYLLGAIKNCVWCAILLQWRLQYSAKNFRAY